MNFPSEFQSELDQIRSELMEKVAEDVGDGVDYIRYQLYKHKFNEQDCKSMIDACKLASDELVDIEEVAKEAVAKKKGIMDVLTSAPAKIFASLLAATATVKGVQSAKHNIDASGAYKAVMKENPQLKKNKHMDSYFETVKHFAPAVAGDKNVLRSALEHAHEYGRMDYPLVKDLIQMQSGMIQSKGSAMEPIKTLTGGVKAVSGLEV